MYDDQLIQVNILRMNVDFRVLLDFFFISIVVLGNAALGKTK